jgi:uncharacterized protein (DUF2236 family)
VSTPDLAKRLRRWAADSADPVEGFFGPASITWKVNREAAVYLGGMRALLMQIAHPLVAQGVADHSDFRADPFARLRRTFDSVHAMVFGTRDEALDAALTLWGVHGRVKGESADGRGRNVRYSARDPKLLLWVLATLVDTSLRTYEMIFAPLTPRERTSFYGDAKIFARLCGLEPDELPATLEDFDRNVAGMLDGPELHVTDTAKEIAAALFAGPPLLRLFAPGNYVLAAGMLPPTLRDQFELSWSWPVRSTFYSGIAAVRLLTPYLPDVLRTIPSARRADRRCADAAAARGRAA